jgi:hypothetical protein
VLHHATLKSFLRRSNLDLMGVYQRLLGFWEDQHNKISVAQARAKNKPRHDHQCALFTTVLRLVHGFALSTILREQAKLGTKGEAPEGHCLCTITASHGLPCYHTIWQRMSVGELLRLDDIHPHWHYSCPQPNSFPAQGPQGPLLLNPTVVKGKGKPKGALGGGRATGGESDKYNPIPIYSV